MKKSTALGILLMTSLALLPACLMNPQDPDEIFGDGRPPAALERVANPKPSADVVRAALDSRGQGVTVAVIDEGVDYRHPFLADKIRYQFRGNEIVGAGHDFLGNDSWPHPNLVDPAAFAFGATLVDGKIRSPLEDPIKKLDELNDEFVSALIPALAAEPTLAATLFKKMKKGSIHVLGAYDLVLKSAELLKRYKEKSQVRYMLDENTLTSAPDELRIQFTSQPDGLRRAIFDEPWTLGPKSSLASGGFSFGLPSAVPDTTLSIVRGFDKFLEIVRAQFGAFDSRTRFVDRYFEPYHKYRFQQDMRSEKSKTRDVLALGYAADLYQQWYRASVGYSSEDPIRGAASAFCFVLTDAELAMMRSSETPAADKRKFVLSHIDRAFDLARKFNELVKGSEEASFETKYNTARMEERNPAYKKWIIHELDRRGWEPFYCRGESKASPLAERYRDYAERTSHPYLESDSTSRSHGTHVSGIIVSQEPTARILPVRVITASRLTTRELDEKTKADFLKDFEAWLNDPLALAGAAAKLADYLPADPAKLDAEKLRSVVMSKMAEGLPIVFERQNLTFYFSNQLRAGLKYVGEQKVKIANVSLGEEFAKLVTPVSDKQHLEFLDAVRFLVYEYYKYSIGEILNGPAKDTLFVVAAGNDHSWLNSTSRSGLPCDVSSSFLHKIADEKHLKDAPNNAFKNILCVGSIDDRDEDLSEFTNIILKVHGVPFVFSYGEAIPSALKSEDCAGVFQVVADQVGPDPVIQMNPKSIEAWAISESGGKLDPRAIDGRAQLQAMTNRLYKSAQLLSGLSYAAKMQECIAGDYVANGRMSGTSMAAPAVAGQAARLVASKLAKMRLSEEQAFEKSELAPERLIKDLFKQNPKLGGDTLLRKSPKLTKTRPYLGSGSLQLKVPTPQTPELP